ncbi:uncharacterized protein LOC110429905 [Sorghum bicolor]|nr:uncharacterized protein LOC110429905 [Sorghum bicolor]|eukprot:XP_021302318.1 uncharacterized protein LOC110429905 [Sorghum bicolor]
MHAAPCFSPRLKLHLTQKQHTQERIAFPEGKERKGGGAPVVARRTMEAADASPLEVSPRVAAGSWRRTTSRPWSRCSSIGRSGSSSGGSGGIEYTSLRDVLEEEEHLCGGAGGGGECGAGGGGGCGEHQHQHQHQQLWRWGSSWGEYSCHDIHDFDASNIGIRNQLLKHAASAYLQSAVVVAAGRDQGCCLARLWRRAQLRGGGRRGRGGRGRVLMRACSWQGCVDDPAAAVASCARRLVAFVADRVSAIWAW